MTLVRTTNSKIACSIFLFYFIICSIKSAANEQNANQNPNSQNQLKQNIKNCTLPLTISCPPAQYCFNQQSIQIPLGANYNCTDVLQLQGNIVYINPSNLSDIEVNASYVYINSINLTGSLVIGYDSFIYVTGQNIVSEYFLINVQAKSTVQYSQNFDAYNNMTILFENSTLVCQKIIMQSLSVIQIKGSYIKTTYIPCLYTSINIESYEKYIFNGDAIDLTPLTLQSQVISIFILCTQSLTIEGSNLKSGTIFLIGQNQMNINNSSLNSTAMACRSNMGPGRGLAVQMGSNYCTSGSSSSGYGMLSNSQECQEILQYFMFLTHAFPYSAIGPYLATGSGGYGYALDQRGAGGGIIFMFTKGVLAQNNTYIGAEGGFVGEQYFGTAGSGGTIYQWAEKLSGSYVNISVSGGASYNNNGSGAGGKIKISYLDCDASIYTQWINVSQGYQPNSPNLSLQANGIFYGPECPQGTWRYYFGCQPCPPGTYSGLGDIKCKECPVSPRIAINFSSKANTNLQMCYNQEYRVTTNFLFEPGSIDFISIIVYMGCLLIFIIVGVIIVHKKTKKRSILETEKFDFENAGKQMSDNNIITEQLKNDKTFRLADLMYHIHRVTVNGCNSYRSPWMLILTPPQQIREFVLQDSYQQFAQKFNKLAKWSFKQKFFCRLLMTIYPLYWYYYMSVKKSKYSKIMALVEETKDNSFLNNYQESRQIVMKVSKNTDYTIFYFDFFSYKKSDLKYFLLSSPFIVWLSGQGTFIKPFYICQQDIFLTALFFTINRNLNSADQIADERQKLLGNLVEEKKRHENTSMLIRFINKFNIVSSALDLASPSNNFFDTILDIIQELKFWNQELFNKCLINIDFILVFSQTDGKKLKSSTITLITDKNPKQLEQAMKQITSKINTNSFTDIKFGLFIYNPEQQIQSGQLERRGAAALDQVYLSDKLGFLSDPNYEDIIVQQQNQVVLLEKPSNSRGGFKEQFLKHLKNFGEFLRYLILSHRQSSYDKYLIKFLQSLLILFQAMLVFIWSIKIQVPYIFVNLVAPFIGVIWIVSDSYGLGKTYLMLNSMNLLNYLISLIIYVIILENKPLIVICQITNFLVAILIQLIGIRSITYSRKLSSPEMFN